MILLQWFSKNGNKQNYRLRVMKIKVKKQETPSDIVLLISIHTELGIRCSLITLSEDLKSQHSAFFLMLYMLIFLYCCVLGTKSLIYSNAVLIDMMTCIIIGLPVAVAVVAAALAHDDYGIYYNGERRM